MLDKRDKQDKHRYFGAAVAMFFALTAVIVTLSPSRPVVASSIVSSSQEGRLTYTVQQFGDGSWYTGIYLADMDYDGKPEILIGNRSENSLEIWKYNLGTMVKIDSITFPYHVHDIKVADFDDDCDMDVVVGVRFNGIFYANNTGSVRSVGKWNIQKLDGQYSWQVLVEDFDNDYNLDILDGVDYGPIRIFYGDGRGNFNEGPPVQDPLTDMRAPMGFNAIDINSDGWLDLIGTDGSFLRAFLNPGERDENDKRKDWISIGPTTPVGTYPCCEPTSLQTRISPSAGDLDKNGVVDQVAFFGSPESTAPLEILLFKGSNTASGFKWDKVVVGTITNPGRAWNAETEELIGWAWHAGTADLNGDGNLDIHVGGWDRFNGLPIYLGDGAGNFTPDFIPLDHGVGEFNSFAVSDLNGDGGVDFITNRYTSDNQEGSGFEVFFGTGQKIPLLLQVAADSSISIPGGMNGYTITITNQNANAVVLTTLEDELLQGFSYVPNSTTGLTTINPSIVGQKLTWNGQYNIPAYGIVTLHFNVLASSSQGLYTNKALGSAADGYTVNEIQNAAPIIVSTQSGAINMGFRLDPDAYSFPNYGGNYPDEPSASDFTIDDMVQMFGQTDVCTNATGPCQPRTAASDWRDRYVKIMNGGHCDGFTTTALRFFKRIDQPSTYQTDATATRMLKLENIRRRIAYFWMLQIPSPVASASFYALFDTPTQVLQKLYQDISTGAPDPMNLGILNASWTSGHSILPYAIEDTGNGRFRIWVYDNNHPYDSQRAVNIDTFNNSWDYPLSDNVKWCSTTDNSLVTE
jgi:hypothetical protein